MDLGELPDRSATSSYFRHSRSNSHTDNEVVLELSAKEQNGINSGSTLRAVLSTNFFEETVFSIAYVTVRNNELPAAVAWILMVWIFIRSRVGLYVTFTTLDYRRFAVA
jgi:hypothetical protein